MKYRMAATSHTEVGHIHSDASPRQWDLILCPMLRGIGLSELLNPTRNPVLIYLSVIHFNSICPIR